jgi:hypothetical protein
MRAAHVLASASRTEPSVPIDSLPLFTLPSTCVHTPQPVLGVGKLDPADALMALDWFHPLPLHTSVAMRSHPAAVAGRGQAGPRGRAHGAGPIPARDRRAGLHCGASCAVLCMLCVRACKLRVGHRACSYAGMPDQHGLLPVCACMHAAGARSGSRSGLRCMGACMTPPHPPPLVTAASPASAHLRPACMRTRAGACKPAQALANPARPTDRSRPDTSDRTPATQHCTHARRSIMPPAWPAQHPTRPDPTRLCTACMHAPPRPTACTPVPLRTRAGACKPGGPAHSNHG